MKLTDKDIEIILKEISKSKEPNKKLKNAYKKYKKMRTNTSNNDCNDMDNSLTGFLH